MGFGGVSTRGDLRQPLCSRESGVLCVVVASYLELLQSETSASARAAVVLDGRALNDRSETVGRAGSNASSFGDTSITTAVLAAGLLEVHLHPALPVLVEVPIRDDVVVLDRLSYCC